MIHKEHGTTQLLALDRAEGITVGSTMIDAEVRKLVEQKLRNMHVYAAHGLTRSAELMMEKSGFEFYKCNFGEDASLMDFCMAIPGREGHWVKLR